MKNEVFRLVDNLRSRIQKPKIFSMVLNSGQFSHLSQQAAFSLEEAFGYAREEFVAQNPNANPGNMNIQMFIQSETTALFSRFLDIKFVEDEEDKNGLMKRIIDNKDAQLLEENKTKFSENELRYLLTELKK